MGDLVLEGNLMLFGTLELEADGGKVKVGDSEALVEGLSPPSDGASGTAAPPVMLPPPPVGGPTDPGTSVKMISSFNKTVKAGGKNVVTLGIVMQGDTPMWPGMMLPSVGNTGPVTVNGIPINVQNDQAMIFPSGGVGTFDSSGQ
jgi:hypothetical protein